MNSETTMIFMQYRFQEWTAQIGDCRNRSAGMSGLEWCACNGITKAVYYYRLRYVRTACNLLEAMLPQRVVSVELKQLQYEKQRQAGFWIGYHYKRIFHPYHARNIIVVVACYSSEGGAECSTMPPEDWLSEHMIIRKSDFGMI